MARETHTGRVRVELDSLYEATPEEPHTHHGAWVEFDVLMRTSDGKIRSAKMRIEGRANSTYRRVLEFMDVVEVDAKAGEQAEQRGDEILNASRYVGEKL